MPYGKLSNSKISFQFPDVETKPKKVKYDNPNLNYPVEMPVDTVVEMALRDNILEIEEKIRGHAVGSLKVNDREAWRKAINEGTYDKQCDKLVSSFNSDNEVDVAFHLTIEKIKSEAKHSRPNTPDSEVGSATSKTYRDPGKYLGPAGEDELPMDPTQQESIKKMACAILQLLQAMDAKFLTKPLGPDPKDKKYSGEECRERWEQSLLASTSWSQLSVHLHTLSASIAWRKGSNARCCVCRKRSDAEKMLLCDGCDKGHHLYCLKPKLSVSYNCHYRNYLCGFKFLINLL